jgi:hypothetical protein
MYVIEPDALKYTLILVTFPILIGRFTIELSPNPGTVMTSVVPPTFVTCENRPTENQSNEQVTNTTLRSTDFNVTHRYANRLVAVNIQESNFTNKSRGMIKVESDCSATPSIIWILVIVLLNNERLFLWYTIPCILIRVNQRIATIANAWARRSTTLIRTAQVCITVVIVGSRTGSIKHPGSSPRSVPLCHRTVSVFYGRNDDTV